MQDKYFDATEFQGQLSCFMEGFRLERKKKRNQKYVIKKQKEMGTEAIKQCQNIRKMKSRANNREAKGPEVIKADQNKWKGKSRANLREEKGPEVIKSDQNKCKGKSRANIREEKGPELVQENQNKWKRLSRQKQRDQNPKKVKEDQNKWQYKARLIDSDKKRLLKFIKRTMHNAIFICICCQRRLLECNVSKWTTKLESVIETKKPGLFVRAIENPTKPILVNVNGEESSYICHACKIT